MGFDTVTSSYDLSPLERGIFSCRNVLRSDIQIRLGKGDMSLFWNGRWCGEASLSALFPNLFVIVADPRGSISQVFDPLLLGGAWAPTFKRALR